VHTLHQAGLFHGSLHPDNVLFTSDYRPVITDCVTLAFKGRGLIDPQSSGSALYTAPELGKILDKPFDFRDPDMVPRLKAIDVYSLALIFYEILTGTPVFSPKLALMQLIRQARSTVRPEIPDEVRPEFAGLIQRSWDPEPRNRPSIDEIWNYFSRNQTIGTRPIFQPEGTSQSESESGNVTNANEIQVQN
jgi:serine/threonine protein kinase